MNLSITPVNFNNIQQRRTVTINHKNLKVYKHVYSVTPKTAEIS